MQENLSILMEKFRGIRHVDNQANREQNLIGEPISVKNSVKTECMYDEVLRKNSWVHEKREERTCALEESRAARNDEDGVGAEASPNHALKTFISYIAQIGGRTGPRIGFFSWVEFHRQKVLVEVASSYYKS